MPRRKKPGTEAYHDRVAPLYDAMYEGSVYWELFRRLTWNHIKPHLPSRRPARALDVGCGTGLWGLKLLRSGFEVDFLDISREMLERVAEKLQHERAAGAGELYHASIDDLSALDAERYDLVIGQGDPLSCAASAGRALKEMTRLLRPGGIMVQSVDNRYAGLEHYLEKKDLGGLERFLRTGRTEWLTDEPGERFELHMFTPESLRKLFEDAGYRVRSLIGKTVLPLRALERSKAGQALLADRKALRRLLAIEESLHAVPALLGRASHLEIIAEAPGGGHS